MENLKSIVVELFNFSIEDFNLESSKYGVTSTIGAVSGAMYEGKQVFIDNNIPIECIDFDSILKIAFSAFIGLVVTFIGRKIMTAFWDHLIVKGWKYLLKKLRKQN